MKLLSLNRAQRSQTGLLGLGQSLDMGDVHAFVGPLANQGLQALVSLRVPELDCSVVAAAGEQGAVEIEGDGSHAVGVAAQDGEALAGGALPEADGLVFTSAGKQPSIGAEGDRAQPARVPLQDAQAFAGARAPETSGLIFTAAGKRLSVRAEGD